MRLRFFAITTFDVVTTNMVDGKLNISKGQMSPSIGSIYKAHNIIKKDKFDRYVDVEFFDEYSESKMGISVDSNAFEVLDDSTIEKDPNKVVKTASPIRPCNCGKK